MSSLQASLSHYPLAGMSLQVPVGSTVTFGDEYLAKFVLEKEADDVPVAAGQQ